MPDSLPRWLEPHRGEPGIGSLVDHTLLRAEATEAEIAHLCEEAVRLGLGQVCVNGQWLSEAVRRLGASATRVVTVVGFPLGASGRDAKVAETRIAALAGAHEIDMVIALGWVKSGRWAEAGAEISAVVEAAEGRLVKVILETAALSPEEVIQGARTAVDAGAGAVKTSTGFHPAGGATVEAVRLLRETVGPGVGVKASGGIRTAEAALEMLRAGADRIGTSVAAGWGEVLGPGTPAIEVLVGRPG